MKYYWTTKILADHWSLSFEELELLKTKPKRSHLPFCAQLKHYKNHGSFPMRYKDVPGEPLQYLMDQLNINDLHEYEWKGRSAKRH